MILIACADSETRNYFSECLEPFGLVVSVSDYFTACTATTKLRPKLLFIDIDLSGFEGASQITSMCSISPHTKIVVIGNHISPPIQIDLYLAGAHGCCGRTIKQQQLKRLVNSVESGEIWISRAQIGYLLERLNQRLPDKQVLNQQNQISLSGLTRREKEIAILVSNGKNNRQISQILKISETTVKSHLGMVFRKLGINDRLSLALQISSFLQTSSLSAEISNSYSLTLRSA
jgi:DNA-binding NarL/FixJ family response regulator